VSGLRAAQKKLLEKKGKCGNMLFQKTIREANSERRRKVQSRRRIGYKSFGSSIRIIGGEGGREMVRAVWRSGEKD